MGDELQSWQSVFKSPSWQAYERLWLQINALQEVGKVDSLFDQITELERRLDPLFSTDGRDGNHLSLVKDLSYLLYDRLKSVEKRLRPSRRREPKPDWCRELSRSHQRVCAGLNILTFCQDRGLQFSFLQVELMPDFKRSVEIMLENQRQVASDPQLKNSSAGAESLEQVALTLVDLKPLMKELAKE
ncbi:MAG: hypothetical protein H6624_06450 [Bdellovibrionaceae bacterium]|nr:hypothetical protein [Bdellovibrionales bacterium]MCB9083964.1 hypothetical protein [Pseudobdellovibrionaceae bacterium]